MHSVPSALTPPKGELRIEQGRVMPGCQHAHKVYGLSEAAAGWSALPLPVAMCGVLTPLPTKACTADPAISNTLERTRRHA